MPSPRRRPSSGPGFWYGGYVVAVAAPPPPLRRFVALLLRMALHCVALLYVVAHFSALLCIS
eukprot:2049216-Pyramimonas_sp.AAC.1